MSYSKVLFVGLGGAGQRHLRVLRSLLPARSRFMAYRSTRKTPLLRPDFTPDETRSLEAEFGLVSFPSLESAFSERPDLTVISTPTSMHREPMGFALDTGSAIIVEKPWAESLHGFVEFRNRVIASSLPFQISFQRRFHPLIAKAREWVISGTIGRPVAASFSVFSHVPAWHAYEDWRSLYAVRKELGGGVLLTECHEIDLAYWFFGVPEKVFCSGGNRIDTGLDVEDTVQMDLLYGGLSVQISLCFLHPQQSREFHIAGTDGSVSWTSDGNRLSIITHAEPVAEPICDAAFRNDSMFIDQATAFLYDWTAENSQRALEAAGTSLAIIDAARRSMRSRCAENVILP